MHKRLNKLFIKQQDQSDCGVACLASILRFYGGSASLETLRALSGTTKQGTTLLGLYQALNETGLKSEAFEADIENLKQQNTPCIIHVVLEDKLQHYIVVLQYNNKDQTFTCIDPALGIRHLKEDEVQNIWKSRALLLVKDGNLRPQYRDQTHEKLKWIKELLNQDLNLLVGALFLGLIVAGLGLSTAIFSQQLIDVILPSNNSSKLLLGLISLLFLLLIRSGLSYLRQFFLIRQSKDFNSRLIDNFFGVLLRLPISFFDTRKTGDLIARMNDSQRIQQTIAFLTTNVMIDICMIIAGSTALFFYSTSIGVLTLLCIPIYFFVVVKYHQKIITSQQNVMQAYAQNESHYVDIIQGVADIKSSNKEAAFTKATNLVYANMQNSIFELGKVKIAFGTVSEVVNSVFIVSILGFGSYLALENDLTTGALIAVLQMVGIVMPSAGKLALTNLYLQEAKVATDRLFEYSSIEPEYRTNESKLCIKDFNTLKIQEVSFRFPGRSPLLNNITLDVKKGENIAILGESGSGKTTILHIIQKFYSEEKGNILVDGFPLKDFSTHSWRKFVGVVPQNIKIFNGTLLQNIILEDTPSGIKEKLTFLNEIGLAPLLDKFPQGLSTILGEEGINISGGQKQIMALSRALCRKPQLLLLDEATSAMDRETEKTILKVLEELKQKMGIISLTHRVDLAAKADRIYILDNKTMAQSGDHHQLMESDNLYSRSWNDLLAPIANQFV